MTNQTPTEKAQLIERGARTGTDRYEALVRESERSGQFTKPGVQAVVRADFESSEPEVCSKQWVRVSRAILNQLATNNEDSTSAIVGASIPPAESTAEALRDWELRAAIRSGEILQQFDGSRERFLDEFPRAELAVLRGHPAESGVVPSLYQERRQRRLVEAHPELEELHDERKAIEQAERALDAAERRIRELAGLPPLPFTAWGRQREAEMAEQTGFDMTPIDPVDDEPPPQAA